MENSWKLSLQWNGVFVLLTLLQNVVCLLPHATQWSLQCEPDLTVDLSNYIIDVTSRCVCLLPHATQWHVDGHVQISRTC